MQSLPPLSTLIIGYGNTLRSDDGAGQAIAETVESWGLEGVSSLAVHQLTPELAAEMAQSRQVIFVDVYPSTRDSPQGVQVTAIAPGEKNPTLGHASSPQSLLALCQVLYQTTPVSYWVLVPAENFEFGESFSPLTTQNIPLALEEIQTLLSCR
ncbi:hydrogenase maturation protease [Spirulina subsalsa FACHB-351]|uniref:Hydrogenase maturation protease n=1 Tax=Spirulina subsalsa FACHB-351 TaxID=234711 RepID=A0ABT3L0M8_9CYAN|nr:hydrogenase maturation protease [Spirulina subsalsa]MCW6035054.1 hydrogenase maturation protease [Spirulina subsalsa FACHB-351]